MEFVPFDEELSVVADALLSFGKPMGLSLGDRACLALGRLRRIPVLTADAD